MINESITFDKLPQAVSYLNRTSYRVEANGISTSTYIISK